MLTKLNLGVKWQEYNKEMPLRGIILLFFGQNGPFGRYFLKICPVGQGLKTSLAYCNFLADRQIIVMDREEKRFTASEASATLPLVKRIVRDILKSGKHLQACYENYEMEDHPEVLKAAKKVREHLTELEELGCYFKDWNFDIGLVDFPAIIDGERVMLCWKSDEESLQFYHGENEGFNERRTIPEHYLSSDHALKH